MTTKSTNTPTAILAKIAALVAGTTKNIVGKATITVAGTAMTAAQIVAKLAAAPPLYAAVTAARQTLTTALTVWEAALPGLRKFITQYEDALKGTFGVDSPQLQDFGISPKKAPAPRTAAQKAVSSALAKQTKAVRGPTTAKARAKVTTQGTPGLVLVSPDGTPIPGGIQGPTPPGSSQPVDAAANLAPVGGTPSSVSTPPVAK